MKTASTEMISTEVFDKGPKQFTQTGKYVGQFLRSTKKGINQDLAKKLLVYAQTRFESMGLTEIVEKWQVTVGTPDGDEPAKHRSYYVEWKNKQGTSLSLVGILLRKGAPMLDHGVEISTD